MGLCCVGKNNSLSTKVLMSCPSFLCENRKLQMIRSYFPGWVVDWFRMPFLVENANKRGRHPDPYVRKHVMDAYVLWMPLGLLGRL